MKSATYDVYNYLEKLQKVYPDMTIMEIVYRAYKFCHGRMPPGLRYVKDSDLARSLEKFYKKDGATD